MNLEGFFRTESDCEKQATITDKIIVNLLLSFD